MGNLDVVLDLSAIRQKFEKEDTTPVRPVPLEIPAPVAGGCPRKWANTTSYCWLDTDLLMPGLAEKLIKSLWIKDEAQSNGIVQGSASAVVVINAQQTGFDVVKSPHPPGRWCGAAGMAGGNRATIHHFCTKNCPTRKNCSTFGSMERKYSLWMGIMTSI